MSAYSSYIDTLLPTMGYKRPEIPAGWPRWLRCLCLGILRLPRGKERLLRHLARWQPVLRGIRLDLAQCGPLVIDLAEAICVPLFVNGYYRHQLPEDVFLTGALRPGDRVFDIGANLGYYTRLFSKRVGNNGQVIAVEPMPRALAILCRNCEIDLNTLLVRAAAGSAAGTALLFEQDQMDRSFVGFSDSGDGLRTAVVTVDQLAAEHGVPDLIKIDVEGAEKEVLLGARATLSGARAPVVMFEYIAGNAAPFGAYTLPDLISILASDGYRIFRLGWPCKLHHWRSQERGLVNDYVALPPSRPAVGTAFCECAGAG